jgi:hypothetical protein
VWWHADYSRFEQTASGDLHRVFHAVQVHIGDKASANVGHDLGV